MLADQNGFKPFFHQLLAGPRTRIDAGVEGRRDLAIAPSFAGFRGVRLQPDAGLGQLAGRMLSRMYQRGETLPLLTAELHHIFLHGNLFRGHEASPSLRSHRDSEIHREINDGGYIVHSVLLWVVLRLSSLKWSLLPAFFASKCSRMWRGPLLAETSQL
jgi:hypothetical protein